MAQQTSLFNKEDKPQSTRKGKAQEMLGCCSRYRECSDAGKCLIPDVSYAADCAYRKNLESGRIFYGKKQNGFSLDRYEEFRKKIDALTPDARAMFDNIVIDLCEYNRGANRCMVRNVHIAQLEEIGLFEFHRLGAEFPMAKIGKWDYRKVLELVYNNEEYLPLFKQAQERRKEERRPLLDELKEAQKQKNTTEIKRLENQKKALDVTNPGEDTKEFLRNWLNHEATPLRDLLAEPYRFACIKPELGGYMEEIYQDLLIDGFDSRIYLRSPYAEDGLLSIFSFEDEELRRLKLSKGYPEEDKNQRIEMIQQTRAIRTANRRKLES